MSYTNSQGLIYSFKYILDFYYGDVPIKTILLMSGSDDEHFSLESVIDVSKEVNLHVELQKIQPERVSKHLLPVILYKESLPPLVLLKLDKDEATLFDGKENSVVTKKISELKEYDSVVYFFRDKSDKEFIQERKKEKEWFFKPIKEEWRSYTEVAILTVFINIFILAVPLYTMSVYDRVIPNFATNTLKVLAFGVVIILIFDFIFKGVRSYIIENVGKRLGNSLEEELMNKILHIQPKYDEIQVGAKVNLFSELSRVKEFFASKTMINILDFPFFLFMMFVIYLISPTLASIPFFGALIILGVSYFIHLIGDRLREDSFEHVQSKNSFLVETIGGRDSIKLANASPKRLFEFRQLIGFTNSIILKLQMFNVHSLNFSHWVIQMVVLLVVFTGVYEIQEKSLTIGGLIAVTILSSRVMVPIVNFSSVVARYKEFTKALETLNDFWYLPNENSGKTEVGVEKFHGNIEFDEVDYYYKKSKNPVLKNVSFKINHGEKVAFIGQTGAGKSTILKLLTGIELPTKGKVFLDSHDLDTIHNVEIRKNIGVMPQEPFLFSGTLKENIELSRSVSKEELMDVIQSTGLHNLVKKSAKGETLQVGERGSNLSVGQRHLVTLARAILSNPSILILDEPTTGLDIGLEKELIKKIKTVVEDKTLIVITHRMAALELVDRVFVVKDGQIAVSGPRDKVLAYLRNPNGGKK